MSGVACIARRMVRFVRLAPADRRLLLETALWLAASQLALFLFSFGTVLELQAIALRRPRGSRIDRQTPTDRVVWAMDLVGKCLPATKNCLTRALAAQVLLTRWSHPVQFQIGVAKDPDDNLQAHAWLKTGGEVVIGRSGVEAFTPLSATHPNNL
jgi:Transglutaminase-like superfamily